MSDFWTIVLVKFLTGVMCGYVAVQIGTHFMLGFSAYIIFQQSILSKGV